MARPRSPRPSRRPNKTDRSPDAGPDGLSRDPAGKTLGSRQGLTGSKTGVGQEGPAGDGAFDVTATTKAATPVAKP